MSWFNIIKNEEEEMPPEKPPEKPPEEPVIPPAEDEKEQVVHYVDPEDEEEINALG